MERHTEKKRERETERDKENIRSLETCEVPHASLCSIFACLFQVRSVFAIEVHLCTIKQRLLRSNLHPVNTISHKSLNTEQLLFHSRHLLVIFCTYFMKVFVKLHFICKLHVGVL